MPLNPNGKIDKPALPFPDTATIAALAHPSSSSKRGGAQAPQGTPTEAVVQAIWKRLLPHTPEWIPLDENFFDLGGHSILATRLVFEIRKTLVVNAPLGIVFDKPTIRGLAKEIDKLRSGDFGLAAEDQEPAALANGKVNGDVRNALLANAHGDVPEFAYATDAAALAKTLRPKYEGPPASSPPRRIFLTGATGFLGAFILKDLLDRPEVEKVICHVRADDEHAAHVRLRESGVSRGVWDDSWPEGGRLSVEVGDLEARQLGLTDDRWAALADEVDAVIHNGALVHWVYPYSKLRPANVVATAAAIDLAATGRPKTFTFVSSTAVLEKAHYVALSDAIVQKGGKGVPEDDPLDATSTGLTNGYGQTKWVAEKLVREAGRRGLKGGIIRPAYIVGDSTTAVTNADDFLWRLVKGCTQLGLVPDINNTVNMLPVDHVARCVSLCALATAQAEFEVYHLTARPLPRFNAFLGALKVFGWQVARDDYISWRTKLEQHVLASQDNALFPLLHFVLDDLPTSTKTAELDDSNTVALLAHAGGGGGAAGASGVTVGEREMGKYLAWLVAVGFLDRPNGTAARSLPQVADSAKLMKAIGRSGR